MKVYLPGHSCLGAGIVLAAALSFAQNQAPASGSAATNNSPLGTAARNLKTQSAAHTRKVFTEDDMDEDQSPVPPLNMSGEENASDVVAAIARFKQNHSAKETEDTVREWYNRYDQALATAIQANLEIAAGAFKGNGEVWPCRSDESTQECLNRRRAERDALDPTVQKRKNENVIVCIQQGFMKIRRGMYQNGLRYDWFKVRTSNGTGSF